MLRIGCPFCGERDHAEFHYGGDASVERPPLDHGSREDWYRYVFVRANPKGRHREYWQHVHGCRSWLVVERDTGSHAILAVEPAAGSPEHARDE